MSAVLTPIKTQISLEQLADQWADAKQRESMANAERITIETQLIQRLGKRDEGAETHSLPDGRKVVITGKFTRKLDEDIYRGLADKIPEGSASSAHR